MAEATTCPKCGAELPADVPAEMCLNCSSGEGRKKQNSPVATDLVDATLSLPVESAADTCAPRGTSAGASIRHFGNYELLAEIARGGMGVVYKARQVRLNRTVAVKMILAGQLASDEDVRRFYAEAQTAANLQHLNIVAIHEVGEHDGQHFFSMDFVEGKSLGDLIREHPLPARKSAEYVKTIAHAVHYAHLQGILHRDLKPSNVLINRNDHPQITDFGLAKRIEGGSELTGTGQVLDKSNGSGLIDLSFILTKES